MMTGASQQARNSWYAAQGPGEDVGQLAALTVDIQDVNTAGTLDVTSVRLDTGWSTVGTDVLLFTGSPNLVRINLVVHQSVSGQRRAPTTLLERSNDGTNWTDLVQSASGYIRNASGHTESSNTLAYTDPTPGTDPRYRVTTRAEASAGVTNSVADSAWSLEAIL